MKITLQKIPYIFKNVPLEKDMTISSKISAVEGAIVAVKVKSHLGKKNDLDYANGRLGWLWEGDIIPAVLGYRKAAVEFAGIIPQTVSVGDKLYLLCESGLVGIIKGVFPQWGNPLPVEVLGSIIGKDGSPMNLKHFLKHVLVETKKKIEKKIPLIIFLGTIMDSGKTTMACKLIHSLKKQGKSISVVKLTGVAFSQDLMKLQDAGADKAYDFVDMGLPSTCNGNATAVVQAALNLIEIAKKSNPDYIFIEFGDGVLGEYHVGDILKNQVFSSQIKKVILAAKDFAGIKGTKDILKEWGIDIDLITGMIANSEIGIRLIDNYFGIPAESNQNEVIKTTEIILKK